MTYFKNFDFIKYNFAVAGEAPRIEVIPDIMKGITLNISDKDLETLTDTYIIREGMKPEEVAYILYDDPFLHWTILYVNKIVDINAEWPLDEIALRSFVTKKYGAGHEYDIHHYRRADGVIIDSEKEYTNANTGEVYSKTDFCKDTYNTPAISVSNYDYESELNFDKSVIKTIKPARMTTFLAGFYK